VIFVVGVRAPYPYSANLMTQPLLSINGAHKQYAGTAVLTDVSLDLWPGEVHALMGENGAGKSTLIKLMAGVVAADSMDVLLNGTPITLHDARAAFAHGLRFIHQELNVVPALSIAENIFLAQPYPRRLGALVHWRALNREAARLLSELGITHLKPTDHLSRLSPGDQMLVKIAAAFVGEGASIYVMDEPTAALSLEESNMLFEVIRRLRQRGCAVLYVSHRMDDIFKIANRVTVLRDGHVVLADMLEYVTPDDLIRAMTGRQLQQVFPERKKAPSNRPLLRVDGLTTNHLYDISFELHEGEILGVAGLTGAGRTPLLRALMGADRKKRGEIMLDGVRLSHRTPAGAWQQRIAFIPEERRSQGVILSHSVAHNVVLPHWAQVNRASVLAHSRAETRITSEYSEAVRLKARGHHQRVRQLSGGNQQKVLFARALAAKPRVLLLDEPTRGIDVGAKYDLYTLIRQMSAQGTGILMASSDLLELLGLCDRILILRQGRLVNVVQADGLREEDLLSLCYGHS
jgi:ribose transport system ATP-binding protein